MVKLISHTKFHQNRTMGRLIASGGIRAGCSVPKSFIDNFKKLSIIPLHMARAMEFGNRQNFVVDKSF